jgi:hypothetical protein
MPVSGPCLCLSSWRTCRQCLLLMVRHQVVAQSRLVLRPPIPTSECSGTDSQMSADKQSKARRSFYGETGRIEHLCRAGLQIGEPSSSHGAGSFRRRHSRPQLEMNSIVLPCRRGAVDALGTGA